MYIAGCTRHNKIKNVYQKKVAKKNAAFENSVSICVCVCNFYAYDATHLNCSSTQIVSEKNK